MKTTDTFVTWFVSWPRKRIRKWWQTVIIIVPGQHHFSACPMLIRRHFSIVFSSLFDNNNHNGHLHRPSRKWSVLNMLPYIRTFLCCCCCFYPCPLSDFMVISAPSIFFFFTVATLYICFLSHSAFWWHPSQKWIASYRPDLYDWHCPIRVDQVYSTVVFFILKKFRFFYPFRWYICSHDEYYTCFCFSFVFCPRNEIHPRKLNQPCEKNKTWPNLVCVTKRVTSVMTHEAYNTAVRKKKTGTSINSEGKMERQRQGRWK